MSIPLLSRSPNRVAASPVKESKPSSKRLSHSPSLSSFHDDQMSRPVSATPSSPFQTEVSEIPKINKSLSIFDKENALSTDGFEIFDEERSNDAEASTIRLSPKKQPSWADSSLGSFPRKVAGDKTLSRMREDIFTSEPNSKMSSTYETTGTIPADDGDDYDAVSTTSDDTCFSAFSAVPKNDMTLLASGSPSRKSKPSQTTPHGAFFTPGTSHKRHLSHSSQSPTPRQQKSKTSEGDTTNLLLDFTQQFEGRPNPTRREQSPTKIESTLLSHINNQRMPSPTKGAFTPASKHNVLSLLDFDLPPQPTPRSVPTITVREMESLKSNYLSDISSLKANLSGKDAEIESLKKAVGDAERRVGEALENIREERSAREHMEQAKADWEKKREEIESVIRKVKEEFVYAEQEKEDLLQKLEDSNRLREEAELKAAEYATKASVAQSDIGVTSSDDHQKGHSTNTDAIVAQKVAQELDAKMENLARELHAVYKKKHESKVATLKKTYDFRAEKKCNELQHQIEELTKQNEELQSGKDATFSGVIPCNIAASDRSNEQKQLEAQNAELQEQKARLAGVTEEMGSLRASHAQLLQDLEQERVEKGELVAAVDEMLALQADVGAPVAAVEEFRKSIGRAPSGLKPPGLKQQSQQQPTGLARPTAFGKSKMMSNIERMGGGRGP